MPAWLFVSLLMMTFTSVALADCTDHKDPRTCDEEGLDTWFPDRDKRSWYERKKDTAKDFVHEQAQKGECEEANGTWTDGTCRPWCADHPGETIPNSGGGTCHGD